MTFGRLLADAAKRQNVSKYRLAELWDTTPSDVNRILNRNSITERTFKRCARALGMEVSCKLVRRKK